jgi:hypothetical protein
MTSLSHNELVESLIVLTVALMIWHRTCFRDGRFSIKSLLILTAIIAIWLALFGPTGFLSTGFI